MLSESLYTAPRDDCPHPEWWHCQDDESAEVEVSALVGAFVRALQPEIVVETGTAFGYTAEQIGLALRANGHGFLWTLETSSERAEAAKLRCALLPVEVVNSDSLTWEPPGLVDFAWIDGHIDNRVEDFWHLPLRKGAIVGFHDTGPQHGYRDRVEALGHRQIYLRTPRGVTFLEVTE